MKILNILLINCEVELILTCFKNCVLINKSTRNSDYNVDPIIYQIDNPENAIFQITDTKLSSSYYYFVKRKWYKTFRTI